LDDEERLALLSSLSSLILSLLSLLSSGENRLQLDDFEHTEQDRRAAQLPGSSNHVTPL
jgi:hypothetical protein